MQQSVVIRTVYRLSQKPFVYIVRSGRAFVAWGKNICSVAQITQEKLMHIAQRVGMFSPSSPFITGIRALSCILYNDFSEKSIKRSEIKMTVGRWLAAHSLSRTATHYQLFKPLKSSVRAFHSSFCILLLSSLFSLDFKVTVWYNGITLISPARVHPCGQNGDNYAYFGS